MTPNPTSSFKSSRTSPQGSITFSVRNIKFFWHYNFLTYSLSTIPLNPLEHTLIILKSHMEFFLLRSTLSKNNYQCNRRKDIDTWINLTLSSTHYIQNKLPVLFELINSDNNVKLQLTIEWPYEARLVWCCPTCAAAITKHWFSMARARSNTWNIRPILCVNKVWITKDVMINKKFKMTWSW